MNTWVNDGETEKLKKKQEDNIDIKMNLRKQWLYKCGYKEHTKQFFHRFISKEVIEIIARIGKKDGTKKFWPYESLIMNVKSRITKSYFI